MNLRRMEFLLERHRLGEVTPAQAAEVREILATPEGRRRLEEMEADDERILEVLPPKQIAREIERRVAALSREGAPAASPRPWVRWGLVPAALAGALVVVAVMGPSEPKLGATASSNLSAPAHPDSDSVSGAATAAASRESASKSHPSQPGATLIPEQVAMADVPAAQDDGIRTKGDAARLLIHAAKPRGNMNSLLGDSSEVCLGEVVQVSLAQGSAEWVAVLSVDGFGQVTRHIPEKGDSPVLASDALSAPHSFQLDDTPGFERFVLFTSPRPFSVREAERILSQNARSSTIPVPEGWTSRSVLLLKPEPRP